MRFFGLLLILLASVTPLSARAQNQLTYEGRLTDDDGISVPDGAYNLRFQVRSLDSNDCLLFEETKTVMMESGQFIVHLNDGTGNVTASSLSLPDIFTSNTLTVSPGNCASGAGTTDQGRTLKIALNAFGSWIELGSVALTTSPFAFRAHRIGPFSESQLLRTDMGVSAPQLDGSQVSVLTALLSGTYSGNAATATTCSSLSGTLPLASTSGTLPVARGGTGAVSQSDAINNLLPPQSSNAGKILQTDGTNVSWASTPAMGIGTLTGDVTAAGVGAVHATIANNAVTAVKLASDSVDGSKIQDGSITGLDMSFTGVNSATSSFVLKDSSGKFTNFNCATFGEVPTWTVTGFACQTPSLAETDPKIGTQSPNQLSKWDGTRLIASDVHESGGNVGIGTTSPTEKLEVSGKVKAQELCLGADCRAAWSNLATTGPLDLYVSTSGDDANPGTMSLPFRTIQKALDAVPQKVLHPVTINIAPGTYSPVTAPAGYRDSWLLISKDIHYQSGGFLSLIGSGSVQILNANGWGIGITIARSAQGVRLESLSVSSFSRSQLVVDGGVALLGRQAGGGVALSSSPASERALEITNGGQANLENFSASGFASSGISIGEGAAVRVESGTSGLNMPSTPNHVIAIDVGRGGQFEIEGGSLNINALSSPGGGATAFGIRGGEFRFRGGALGLNGAAPSTTVIRAEQGATVSLEALPVWSGTVQTFMSCSRNSSCTIGNGAGAPMTFMSMSANLLFDLSDQSSLRLTQPSQVGSGMSSVQTWFNLNNQSILSFERTFTNSTSIAGSAFVRARNGSTVQLREAFTASSGQPGTWFDLANHSRIHALMNVSLTSTSQTNENPMSFTENSSGLFEQNLTVATSSASGASLFLQGNSSVVVRQTASLTTNALGTSALRLEQNSTAEFQGAFSATGSGSDLRLVSANSGSSLRFKPLSASTNIWVSCSGGSSSVGFDVNNRSSIVFEGPSGRFTTNNIQGGCTTAAQIKNHSRFELSAGMISLTPLNGTISVSRLSTFSKGGTSQVLIAPACSLDSLCD